MEAVAVNEIFQKLGRDFQTTIIAPSVQEVVKATAANFNAEELITNRAVAKKQIEDALTSKLAERKIIVEAVLITDFDFSDEFNKAIEQKVTALQLSLKAENDLKRIKIEAEQVVVKAEGEAKAINVLQTQLARSPEYVKFFATQKWDGKMPQVVSPSVFPFVSIPSSDLEKK